MEAKEVIGESQHCFIKGKLKQYLRGKDLSLLSIYKLQAQ